MRRGTREPVIEEGEEAGEVEGEGEGEGEREEEEAAREGDLVDPSSAYFS